MRRLYFIALARAELQTSSLPVIWMSWQDSEGISPVISYVILKYKSVFQWFSAQPRGFPRLPPCPERRKAEKIAELCSWQWHSVHAAFQMPDHNDELNPSCVYKNRVGFVHSHMESLEWRIFYEHLVLSLLLPEKRSGNLATSPW